MYFSQPTDTNNKNPPTNGIFLRQEKDDFTFTSTFQTNQVIGFNYFGYGKVERIGKFIRAYYSEDSITWNYLSSLTVGDLDTQWGITLASTSNNLVTASFDQFLIFGLNTNCGSNACSMKDNTCRSYQTNFVECSANTWRYIYSATGFTENIAPIITIQSNQITFRNFLNNQPSPLTDEQNVFFFKQLSGDGIFEVSFSPISTLNNIIFGVQIRDIASSGTELKITTYTTYQCFAQNPNFYIVNSRNSTNNLQTRVSANGFTSNTTLRLIKQGNILSCSFWNSTSQIYQTIDTRFFPISSTFHIGVLSNNDVSQSLYNANYTSFTGYCNNRASSCARNSSGSLDQCFCNSPYYDSDCSGFQCFGIDRKNSSVCNSRGNCTDANQCVCKSGFGGNNCQFPTCSGIVSTNSSVCSSQGTCTSTDVCLCNSTHTGNNCQFPFCFGKASNQSNSCTSKKNGNCTGFNTCTCNSGYSGTECEFPTCNGINSTDPSVCSSKGTCIDKDICQCDSQWNGTFCQYPNCYNFSAVDYGKVCSGNGNCIAPNNCSCNITNLNFKCESFLFYWRNSSSGLWSQPSNWVFKSEESALAVDAIRSPKDQDIIFINTNGTYTVTFDSFNENFKQISIGNSNGRSNITVRFIGNSNRIFQELNLFSGTTLLLNNASLASNMTSLHGSLDLKNSNWIFYQNTVLNSSSDLSNATLFFYGNLQVYKSSIFSSKSSFYNDKTEFLGNSSLYVNSPLTLLSSLSMKEISSLRIDNGLIMKNKFDYSSQINIVGSGSITFNDTSEFSSLSTISISPSIGINFPSIFRNGKFVIQNLFNLNSYVTNIGEIEFRFSNILVSPNFSGNGKLYLSSPFMFLGNGSISNDLFVNNTLNITGKHYVNSMYLNSSLNINSDSILEILGICVINSVNVRSSSTGYLINSGSMTVYNSLLLSNIVSNSRLSFQGKNLHSGIFNLLGGLEITSGSSLNLSSTNSFFNFLNSFSGTGELIFDGGKSNFKGVGSISYSLSFINHILSLSGNLTFQNDVKNDVNTQFTISIGSFLTYSSPNFISLAKETFSGEGTLFFAQNSNPTFVSLLENSAISSNLISYSQTIFKGKQLTLYNGSMFEPSKIILETNSTLEILGVFKLTTTTQNFQFFGTLGSLLIKGSLIHQGSFEIPNIVTIQGSIEISSNSIVSYQNVNLFGKCSGPGLMILQKKIDWRSGEFNNIQVQINGKMDVLENSIKFIKLANITINGNLDYLSDSKLILTSSNMIIGSKSIFNQFRGSIEASEYSIINNGYINLLPDVQVSFMAPFINNNHFTIQGKGSTTITPIFKSSPYTTISLLNQSLLYVPDNLTISDGSFIVSGNIVTDLLVYNSNTGLMRFIDPSTNLYINGSFKLGFQGTIFVEMNPNVRNQIFVTNNTILQGLVYIKLIKYEPTLGTEIPFLKSPSYEVKENLNLIGMSFTKASYSKYYGFVNFKIDSSIGLADDTRYRCHYYGNRKTLEYIYFKENNGISLTFTAPRADDGWIGFGFNLEGSNMTKSISVIYSGEKSYQILNHTLLIDDTQSQYLLDFSTSKNQNFFNIGEEYISISMFFQSQIILNQTHFYYAHNLNEELIEYENSSEIFIPKHTYTESRPFKIGLDNDIPCTNFIVPTRAEIYSPAVTGIMLILYLIIAILCMIFYRFQPLNSRGISPYFTLLFLFAQLLLEIRNYFYITPPQQSLCLYYAYGIFPLTQICFLVIFIYFMRYFAIINFNNTKNQASKSQEFKPSKFKIRMLKFISSSWFTVSALSLSFITLILIFTIILASSAYICEFKTLIVLKTVNNIELIIIYALTLSLLFGDIISNYKYFINFKPLSYLRNDPYYFRIQIMLFVPFMIYNLVSEIAIFFITLDYAAQLRNYIATMTLYTITCSIVLLVDVLFPLTITIILFIRRLFQKKKNERKIDQILENPDLIKQFEEFCRNEYSIENILSYMDIQQFKKKKKEPMVIYQTFFSGVDALMEVNVPSSICKEVLAKIESNTFDDKLFDKLEQTIIINLSDTHSRFIFSTEYINYEQKKKLEIELIEGKKV